VEEAVAVEKRRTECLEVVSSIEELTRVKGSFEIIFRIIN